MTVQAQQALRRLGRAWQYPDEPLFKEEWLAGLVPNCLRCGTIIVHCLSVEELEERPSWLKHCQSCEDWLMSESKNSHYDLVLVKEEWGYQHWAWYPEMEDGALENLWRAIQRIPYGRDFDDWLPGEWYPMTQDGFDGHLEYFGNRARVAHIHTDEDSWLKLPTRRYAHNHDWRAFGPQTIYHRGAPKRLLRRQ